MDVRGLSGSIDELPSGSLRARCYVDGVRRQAVVPNEREARAWLRERNLERLEIERSRGTRRASRRDVTIDQVAPELLRQQRSRSLRLRRRHTAGTVRHYDGQVRLLLREWTGPRRIREIRVRHVDEYVREREAAGLASSTIRNRVDRLSQLVEYALRVGYISSRPCRIPRPAVVLASRPSRTPEAEVARLVRAATSIEDPRPLLVVLLAADAGLRAAEILRLRGQDVELGSPERSHYGLVHVAVEDELRRTKSAKGRTVPILTSRLERALRRRGARGRAAVVDELRSVAGIEYQAAKAWSAAGLGERPRLHDLRRRFGSRLAERGVPLRVIQRYMGHAAITTTERYLLLDDVVPDGAGVALEGSGAGELFDD